MMDRYSRAAVRRVGVAQGKRINQEELGQKDSQERRKMRCPSAGGKDILIRSYHPGAHSEDLPLSTHYIS